MVFTWEYVSTGPERSPNLWGRGVSMTTGFSLFGVEIPDACPDVSNTAHHRSSLTSIVMLTSLSLSAFDGTWHLDGGGVTTMGWCFGFLPLWGGLSDANL